MKGGQGPAGKQQEHLKKVKEKEEIMEETRKAERWEKNVTAPGVETFRETVFVFILMVYSNFMLMKQRGIWDKTT